MIVYPVFMHRTLYACLSLSLSLSLCVCMCVYTARESDREEKTTTKGERDKPWCRMPVCVSLYLTCPLCVCMNVCICRHGFVPAMRNALEAVRRDVPKTSGSFGVWGFLYSSFDCTILGLRGKEDPWNSISAGFCTGAMLNARYGPRQALLNGTRTGFFFAVFEGIGIVLNRQATAGVPAPAPLPPPEMTQSPENALLNSANAGGAEIATAPSFAADTVAAPTSFMGDGSGSSSPSSSSLGATGGADEASASSSSSWFGWFGKKDTPAEH